ncbi:hypothetical protein [Roseimicrobium sp. ORNL1]|uniref:hypothetical protein n=1 Tax=Roseimicrobium sp. ORNL1 TaxID=2711231 RepID=UPI0013E10519|nr:hypothetical protein [Roseimicrobium sp. ORNL1]QIF01997.1 hypothetical protein G5S37_10790 [Roseimicrobium sp. ORNL1]
MNRHEHTDLRGSPRHRQRLRLQQHLHAPTLEAVIDMLYRADGVSGVAEAIRLVDAMRPPMEITTMGDLFGHVVDEGDITPSLTLGHKHEQEQEYDDSCEICGVRCASTGFAPHPGLCVRCTAKVQQLQREKPPAYHEEEEHDD